MKQPTTLWLGAIAAAATMMTGCTLDQTIASAMKSVGLDSDSKDPLYMQVKSKFEAHVVGKSTDDLKKIFWDYDGAFKTPTDEYWPLGSLCSYYAVVKNGKVTGIDRRLNYNEPTREYLQQLNGKMEWVTIDHWKYNNAYCRKVADRMDTFTEVGSVSAAQKANYTVFNIEFDKTRIAEFAKKNPRCKVTKAGKNVYTVKPSSCLGVDSEDAIIALNKDGTIGRLEFDYADNSGYDEIVTALTQKYGESMKLYSDAIGWWYRGVEITVQAADNGRYGNGTRRMKTVMDFRSRTAIREGILKKLNDAATEKQNQIDEANELREEKANRINTLRNLL